jgi:hypothetical protein
MTDTTQPEIRRTHRPPLGPVARRLKKARQAGVWLRAKLRPTPDWYIRVPLYGFLFLMAGSLFTTFVIYGDDPLHQPTTIELAFYYLCAIPINAAAEGIIAMGGAFVFALLLGGIPLLVLLVLIAILLKR